MHGYVDKCFDRAARLYFGHLLERPSFTLESVFFGLVKTDASIIYKHIETTKTFSDLLESGLDCGGVRYIEADPDRLAAQLGRHRFRIFCPQIVNDHGGAFLSEPPGYLCAEPRSSPGDQGDLAL